MKYKYVLFLILLFPLLSGCNNTDDVARIFLGKTWKLRTILENNKPSKDYWDGNQDAEKASYDLIEAGNNCTLKFNGTVDGSSITGTLSGRATSVPFAGSSWRADGRSNIFRFNFKSNTTPTDNDILGRAFLNALNNATSYSGDEKNLYIYFKEGQKTKCLLFYVQK